ncbi:MAG: signal peptidase II [Anaerolineales bacterium]
MHLQRKRISYLILILGALVIVAIDQWTKQLVRARLVVGEVWAPIPALGPFIRIINWHNTGAAFGLFPDGGLIFTVIAVVVSVAILYYYPQISGSSWLLRLALILQLGGALGNLTDRLLRGPVTDFVAVGNFPVFNVADASISTGVGLLILILWLEERSQESEPSAAASPPNAPEPPPEPERPVG